MTTTPRSRPSVPSSLARGGVGVLVVLAMAEALTRAELVTPTYLPPASSIVGETLGLFARSEFWEALRATMWATFLGLLRAILIAVPLGLVLGLSKWAYRASITVVELLRPVPSVALIPLAIIVFGRGTSMKVFLITYACIWPILFNTIYGAHSVDEVAVETARAFGLGRVRTALRVNLRAAAPFIFTGVKIAVSVALILVVSAELIAGGPAGLGTKMGEAREQGDLRLAYAYTVVSGLIGLLLYLGFEALERRIFPWNVGSRETAE